MRFLPLATAFRPALAPTNSPIQWVPVALPPAVKRPEREADHYPPSNAEVKNDRGYTPILLHSVMLKLARDIYYNKVGGLS
jgi:hypothetical protein